MTDATPLAFEQITQEDREAAANFYQRYLARPGEVPVAAAFRVGHVDESPLIQAFARHRIAALSATPAPSDQDASQARGEVERLAQDAERLAAESTSRIDAAELRGFATGLRRAAALPPAPGATAQDGVEAFEAEAGAALREQVAHVFATPTPTIPAGMVAEQAAAILDLLECADQMPKATPAPGHSATEHQFTIEAGVIWSLDRAVQRVRKALAAAPKQAEQQGVGK